jgi:hypothetical protein
MKPPPSLRTLAPLLVPLAAAWGAAGVLIAAQIF